MDRLKDQFFLNTDYRVLGFEGNPIAWKRYATATNGLWPNMELEERNGKILAKKIQDEDEHAGRDEEGGRGIKQESEVDRTAEEEQRQKETSEASSGHEPYALQGLVLPFAIGEDSLTPAKFSIACLAVAN